MVEVNDAYRHGGYDKNVLNSLRVMSNVKVFFATQDAGRRLPVRLLACHDTSMNQYNLSRKRPGLF